MTPRTLGDEKHTRVDLFTVSLDGLSERGTTRSLGKSARGGLFQWR